MGQDKFISYLRMPMQQQGSAGLGIDAQREAVYGYLKEGYWRLLKEFVEFEGRRRADRPRLDEALALCQATGATLLIARLEGLSRDAGFLLALHQAGVRFIAIDRPEANETTVSIMAMLAQEEHKARSRRTKEALAAAKARGILLGRPDNLTGEAAQRGRAIGIQAHQAKADAFARQHIGRIRLLLEQGASLRSIARTLNGEGVLTARGKANAWTARAVKNLIDRVRE
jgi:DNA invertase Pin-like site-specific DNA recombinase